MALDERQDCFTYMKSKNLFFKDTVCLGNIWDDSDSQRLKHFRLKKGIRYSTGFKLTKDKKEAAALWDKDKKFVRRKMPEDLL